MSDLDCIIYRGHSITLVPDREAGNPFFQWDGAPTLALSNQAERHFGWTTDAVGQQRLTEALDQIAERGVTQSLYGPRGALYIISRWLRVCYGIPVVLPVSAMEHSGTRAYLGTGHPIGDQRGWDSGWVGWLFATVEQLEQWACDTHPETVEASVRGKFAEFAAWVEGDVVSYQITDPDGDEIYSCYGIYGSGSMDEPSGWALQEGKATIDHDIASRENQLAFELVMSA